jgi:hypothetical protein
LSLKTADSSINNNNRAANKDFFIEPKLSIPCWQESPEPSEHIPTKTHPYPLSLRISLRMFLLLYSQLRHAFKAIYSLLGFRPQIYISLFSAVPCRAVPCRLYNARGCVYTPCFVQLSYCAPCAYVSPYTILLFAFFLLVCINVLYFLLQLNLHVSYDLLSTTCILTRTPRLANKAL